MGEFQRNQGLQDGDLTPYAGRWVARLGKRVIGQGGTPKQALQAAKATRHKETPQVFYVPTQNPFQFSSILDRIRAILSSDVSIYLVGGAVRDVLLGLPTRDLDFALPKGAMYFARQVARGLDAAFFNLDEARATSRLILEDEDGIRRVLDFSAFRGPDLESDLRARDFTINAMAVDLWDPQSLLDPLGGASDLRARLLRACSPSAFEDDPLRIVRAIRLAAGFDFRIMAESRALMRNAVPKLPNVSPERLRDELFRILDGPQVATSIRALDMIGALAHVLPELAQLKGVSQSPPHVLDAWNHTLDTAKRLENLLKVLGPKHDPEASGNQAMGIAVLRLGRYRQQLHEHLESRIVLDRSQRALLFLAALYHDIGKPKTAHLDDQKRIRFFNHAEEGARIIVDRGRALRLSNHEVTRLGIIVRQHMRPLFMAGNKRKPSRRTVYRFYKDTGDAGLEVCLLSLADVLATYGPTLPQDKWETQVEIIRELLETWWEHRDEQIYPSPLINGDDLMIEYGLEPGPIIGELLEMVREAQVVGEISSRRDALSLVREHLS
jgi:putative nucleotidyltransferase with HDIG domain